MYNALANKESRMRRRALICGLAAVLALGALAEPSAAQNEPRHKIGWLKIQGKSHAPEELASFIAGLREHGYIEGTTFEIEERYADGDSSRLQPLVVELMNAGVKIIIATSQPVVEAAHRVTQTLPIVGRMSDNPANLGMARSLLSPGGNVTGIFTIQEDITSVRLAQLHRAVPGLRKVGALLTLDHWDTEYWLTQARHAAAEKGLEVYVMNVHEKKDLETVFASARESGVNGLLAFRSPVIEISAKEIVELSNRHGLPGIFEVRDFVEAGAFMSYGPNVMGVFHNLASFVDQILQGKNPGDLSIGKPPAFELVINVKAARTLGLTVPAPVLDAADLVLN
jgi:putative tryptophan/tyrosine transport system substrate-binding protein